MNRHALSVLEFSAALTRVATRATSEPGRRHTLALEPSDDVRKVQAELDRVGEVMDLLEARAPWQFGSFPDVTDALQALSMEGATLDPGSLRRLYLVLVASRALSETLSGPKAEEGDPGPPDASPGETPGLDVMQESLLVRKDLETLLSGIVDEEGEVRDEASGALRDIRGKMRRIRSRVVRALEGFLGGLPVHIRVEGASVSVREGRYVVPVRREGKGEVGGIVHGESATGSTLFIEPPLAIQSRNELHELEREESAEIQRILREVTGRLRRSEVDLAASFRTLVNYDSLQARALAARSWKGVPPTLTHTAGDDLSVRGGRHPLLLEQGVDVVPFDLDLGSHERAVVVSGPNTGGKTVFLKAMGLIQLLAQSGVVPPVGAGTRLPVLVDVFADIGDEQSIAESLSTFSAHLKNFRTILDGAGPGTLVLIDEMGSGTDPSEGAALARALLEALVERGARALVTSHLGTLKRLDAEGSGIVNASLLFDPERIAPTYQLVKGRPGRSYGLAVARGLGLPSELIDRAEEYVDSGELRLESLLETLEARERELAETLDRVRSDESAAARLRDDLETRLASLEKEERAAERKAREKARQLLLDAREEVEAAIREVRDAGGGEAGREAGRARARVESAARELRESERTEGSERNGKSSEGLRSGAELSEGACVRIRDTGARGVVKELTEERVVVEVGGLRLSMAIDAVTPDGGREGGSKSRRGTSHSRGESEAGGAREAPSGSMPEVDVKMEADLRGLRVDEVELELSRALDGAIVGNLAELRIIHGKGTGAVKARVLELLKGDRRIESHRPGGAGEGGGGVTVVTLP
jgi:DNA mismatch repair protein MutS2